MNKKFAYWHHKIQQALVVSDLNILVLPFISLLSDKHECELKASIIEISLYNHFKILLIIHSQIKMKQHTEMFARTNL